MFTVYLLAISWFQVCYGGAGIVEVTVQQGALLGLRLKLATGKGHYYSFKGIPYAAPPVGNLRFKAPQPALPYKGVRNATEYGSMCPQRDDLTNKYYPGNEDCLFINVFSPDLTPLKPFPVMVFIGGQGFKSVLAGDDFYGPDFVVQEDVILVTFNYRLGALGFLTLNTCDVPGNAGLKDQVAALRWIQDNIKAFGGDPNKVTIVGSGAGAVSVSLHMVSPMSKGLFNGAAPLSGVFPRMQSLFFEAKRRAFKLGRLMGKITPHPEELLVFLQNQPVKNIVETDPTLLTSDVPSFDIANMYYFAPVVETATCGDTFLPDEPEALTASGLVNDVNILTGYTDQEYLYTAYVLEKQLLQYLTLYDDLITPWLILSYVTPQQLLDISDTIFYRYFPNRNVTEVTLINEYIPFRSEAHVISGVYIYVYNLLKVITSNIYIYKFSYLSERNIFSIPASKKFGTVGTTFGDDLTYIFNPKNLEFDKKSDSYKQIKTATTLITNFAKYGNPTPDDSLGVIWPAFTIGGSYLEINDTLSVEITNNAAEIQFWIDIHRPVVINNYNLNRFSKRCK